MWYYGVKLHILAQSNYKAMPTPALMTVTNASRHDLPVAKEMLRDVLGIRVFGDSAFIDEEWQAQMLEENNITILTPIKHEKGQEQLSAWAKLWSTAISSVKQPIESLNNWIIEKTGIQKASKVRSTNGLIAFIYARIACACFCF